MRHRSCTLALLLAAAVAAPLAAQSAPPRPRLDHAQDPKDWRSYFRCAVREHDQDKAKACLAWAERLEPEAPETWYLAWLESDQQDDSLLERARLIDPFIVQSRVVVVTTPPFGIFTPHKDRAWAYFRAGDSFHASQEFEEALKIDSGLLDERWGLAVARYYLTDYEGAAAALAELTRLLREKTQKRLASQYESMEFLEYMQAVAWRRAQRPDSARAAAQRALTENLSLYRAHDLLAEDALDAADTATALQEWSLASDLAGDDIAYRRELGAHFAEIGHLDRAEAELRRVLTLDPDYVEARFNLAVVLDHEGRPADAAREYRAFADRAPRVFAEVAASATARADSLAPH